MPFAFRHSPAARPYFRAFYRGNRLLYALTLALLVLVFPQNLVFSWLLGEVIDVVAAGDLERLWALVRFTGFAIVFFACANIAMYRAKACFIHRALRQYKALAFCNLSGKGISAFTRESAGRTLSVLTNDVGSVEENYLNRSFLLFINILLFAATLGMMCWYSPLITAAALVLGLLPMAASLLMGRELTAREMAVSRQNERFVSLLKDLLAGFPVIKSFKAEGEARQLFETANAALEKTKQSRRWWETLLGTVSENLGGNIMQMGIFLLSARQAIRGELSAGTVLLMLNLCNFLIQPINVVPAYWASRRAAAALVEKLAAAAGENAQRQGEPAEPVLREAIALQKVCFGYEPGKPVLRDVSLRLEAGKKYALVGASGSGKSTLLNLLMGAQDGYEGSITVDGRELRTIAPDSLYDLMSLIDQNVFLFDDTLRRNITMFRDFPGDQVERAVRRSGLAPLWERQGPDYPCGENGSGLSGGERQRVSIARCLLRGTPVLLLDEATAALDNQTAYEVTDAILHLDGVTRLVVTHRLDAALLAQYDEIAVLRGGQICERGRFDALMEAKGYFYSLYTVSNG